jgi:hypothetical protein
VNAKAAQAATLEIVPLIHSLTINAELAEPAEKAGFALRALRSLR